MRSYQRELSFPNGWGGKRKGAGRPGRRSTASHRKRPAHHRWQPIHVTLRARRPLPSLRRQAIFAAIRRTFPRTARSWFHLVHFSVQRDHVHLIVEAEDRQSLGRGMAGIGHPDGSRGQSGLATKRLDMGLSFSRARAHDTTRSPPCDRLCPFQPPQARAEGARVGRMLVGAVVRRMGDATRRPAARRVREPACTRA